MSSALCNNSRLYPQSPGASTFQTFLSTVVDVCQHTGNPRICPLLTTVASVKEFTFRLNHPHMYVDFFINSFYTVVNNFQLVINITAFSVNITYFVNMLFNIVVNCINSFNSSFKAFSKDLTFFSLIFSSI